MSEMIEAWTVRSCIDVAGNHTCWDVCLPSQPNDRGVGVVASVFGDKQVANLIAATPELYAELQQFVNGVETRMIDSPADETLANITARAKVALAKARGEQVHSDPLPKQVGR